ncbi:LysR family transcriptional regulator [Arthrobacter sp. NPDC056727]|uniref:LysR family transcriptional regulator n=1 Tax=Arthrobacter sp. NPDC056727 TaxID=3345927 RepID=UPI00366EF9C7
MVNPLHLRTFIVVLRTGSFAEAARSLGYTGSAVSQQISCLERSVKMVLFERDAHGIRPTSSAGFLAERAQSVLAAFASFEEEVKAMSEGNFGQVRLGSFPTASQQLLPSSLATFARTHGDVGIDLDEGEPEALIPLLLDRDLDLAIVYHYDLAPQAWPKTLKAEPLLHEELILLLPPGHRFTDAGTSLADLEKETWVATGERTSGARSLRRACAAAGFEPEVHYRSDDYDVIRRFVATGLGVALVPALGHAAGSVGTATIIDLPVRRHVVALHASSTINPAVEGAVAALKTASAEAAERLQGVHLA